MDYTERFANALENWQVPNPGIFPYDPDERKNVEKMIASELKDNYKIITVSVAKNIVNPNLFEILLKIRAPQELDSKYWRMGNFYFFEFDIYESLTELRWIHLFKNVCIRQIDGRPLKIKELFEKLKKII